MCSNTFPLSTSQALSSVFPRFFWLVPQSKTIPAGASLHSLFVVTWPFHWVSVSLYLYLFMGINPVGLDLILLHYFIMPYVGTMINNNVNKVLSIQCFNTIRVTASLHQCFKVPSHHTSDLLHRFSPLG